MSQTLPVFLHIYLIFQAVFWDIQLHIIRLLYIRLNLLKLIQVTPGHQGRSRWDCRVFPGFLHTGYPFCHQTNSIKVSMKFLWFMYVNRTGKNWLEICGRKNDKGAIALSPTPLNFTIQTKNMVKSINVTNTITNNSNR